MNGRKVIAERAPGEPDAPCVVREGDEIWVKGASWRGELGAVSLTPEEARWLFAVAGPSVLIALRDAERKRGKR